MDTELIEKLKAYFPANAYRDRKLQGGGKWFFLKWQTIRDRLDQVVPGWSCTYSDPLIVGDLVVIRCKMTIAGVTREGVGNSNAYKERTLEGQGEYKFGSPVECAVADAFKNAAEQFGVGAHIDDQKALAMYLKRYGDNRGVNYALKNDWKKHGAMGTPIKNKTETPKPVKKGKGEISREEWLARQGRN